ncbi:MAG: hypothetical protein ACLFV7_01940 [Phycisphaerae bacterium]
MLETVPKISWHLHEGPDNLGIRRCPECTPWCSCLRAYLEYVEPGMLGCHHLAEQASDLQVDCAYAFLMGVSGAALRLSWKHGWHGDNAASWMLHPDPAALFNHTLEALGIPRTVTGCEKPGPARDQVLRLIDQSLRDGKPAIAHGIVGPPEECLITGYDEGGEVLTGWSFFQDDPTERESLEFEPTGEFRKRNWFENFWDVIVLEDRQGELDVTRAIRESLPWIVQAMRTETTYGRANGLAAFDAWADDISDEVQFGPASDVPLERKFEAHSNAADVIAEGRWYASRYLAMAARFLPYQASDLLAAAACCAKEHELMWELWACYEGPSRGEVQQQNFARPEVRRNVAKLLRRSRDEDIRACEHMETAIHNMS